MTTARNTTKINTAYSFSLVAKQNQFPLELYIHIFTYVSLDILVLWATYTIPTFVSRVIDAGANTNLSFEYGRLFKRTTTPLLLAAQNNHVATMRLLIVKGADAIQSLEYAMDQCDIQTAHALLQQISLAETNIVNLNALTILSNVIHLAFDKGYPTIVNKLIEKLPDFQEKNKTDGYALLRHAISKNNSEAVEQLKRKLPKWEEINHDTEFFVLIEAAVNGQANTKLIISFIDDLFRKNIRIPLRCGGYSNRHPPILIAFAKNGHTAAINKLLQQPNLNLDDLNIIHRKKNTALDYALMNGFTETALALYQHGALPTTRTINLSIRKQSVLAPILLAGCIENGKREILNGIEHQDTPLTCTIKYGRQDLIQMLLANRQIIDLNQENELGNTGLIESINIFDQKKYYAEDEQFRLEEIKQLIAAGILLNHRNHNNETALAIILKKAHPSYLQKNATNYYTLRDKEYCIDVAKLLINAGASLEDIDNEHSTALALAASAGLDGIVESINTEKLKRAATPHLPSLYSNRSVLYRIPSRDDPHSDNMDVENENTPNPRKRKSESPSQAQPFTKWRKGNKGDALQ